MWWFCDDLLEKRLSKEIEALSGSAAVRQTVECEELKLTNSRKSEAHSEEHHRNDAS